MFFLLSDSKYSTPAKYLGRLVGEAHTLTG